MRTTRPGPARDRNGFIIIDRPTPTPAVPDVSPTRCPKSDGCSLPVYHPSSCNTERIWYCNCPTFAPSTRWAEECARCGRGRPAT